MNKELLFFNNGKISIILLLDAGIIKSTLRFSLWDGHYYGDGIKN